MAARRKRIAAAQIADGLQLIGMIPAAAYDHESALSRERVASLAARHHLSAYDAAYLELADRLQCPLLSADAELLRAAKAVGLPT
jgi:predicted nucleic acid-binding protein